MSRLRRFIKNAAARTICQLSVDKVIGRRNGFAKRPLIICYHRVVQDFAGAATRSMPSLLIDVDMFERQLDWLARHYNMVSLDEILSHSADPIDVKTQKGKQMASISFDDGYADFYWNAFPVLKRKTIPASIFVVTDLVGTSNLQTHDELYLMLSQWLKTPGPLHSEDNPELMTELASALLQHSDAYSAARYILASFSHQEVRDILTLMRGQVDVPAQLREELAPLSWDMLRTLSAQGVTIGSHTRSHALLPRHGQKVVQRELAGSRETLEKALGIEIRHFAYPDGQFNERTARSAETAGYGAAYAICAHQSKTHPLYTIPRQVLWQNACIDETGAFSPAILSCLVNGVFQRADQCTQDHSGK